MKIVSLFSGAGGLDFGLKSAGHKIIWANDIFSDAVATYRLNIGTHIVERDISKIRAREIPDPDVVVGGFPCQGFSVANWGRTASDPRNQMYREMLRVVRSKRPAFFIGENVKGLISIGGGHMLKLILKEFGALGYDVRWHVINAADYGVPQLRMRLLILGVRRDFDPEIFSFPPAPTHVAPEKKESSDLPAWITVGKALKHLPEPNGRADIPNHECSRYKLRFNGHLGHRVVDPDRPAPTVTARGDDRGGVVVLHHPGNHRRMTARELAVVQSFPDKFVFAGAKTSAYRQIANAVPPLVGLAIGKMLSKAEGAVKRKRRAVA